MVERLELLEEMLQEVGFEVVDTWKDEIVVHNRVKVIGYTDLPSRMSGQSSGLYANNIGKFF